VTLPLIYCADFVPIKNENMAHLAGEQRAVSDASQVSSSFQSPFSHHSSPVSSGAVLLLQTLSLLDVSVWNVQA